MTSAVLTKHLAERVMGWSVAPGRFMMGNRGWKPDWKFQPTEKREDAFQLLDAAKPAEYNIAAQRDGTFTVSVRIGGTVGAAHETSEPRAIAHAVARAIGLEPTASPLPKTGVDRE